MNDPCWLIFELSNIYKDTDGKLKAFANCKITTRDATGKKEKLIERFPEMHMNVGDTISMPIMLDLKKKVKEDRRRKENK